MQVSTIHTPPDTFIRRGVQIPLKNRYMKKTKDTLSGILCLLVAETGFEPRDLRVMSPTSYQAALLRDIYLRTLLSACELYHYNYMFVKGFYSKFLNLFLFSLLRQLSTHNTTKTLSIKDVHFHKNIMPTLFKYNIFLKVFKVQRKFKFSLLTFRQNSFRILICYII